MELEDFVRQLLDQGAETRNLDYKGPMAWTGTKAERAELVRDLMCFSNTPVGGYILIGVDESPKGWVRKGVTAEQAKTFDVSKIGDLAARYCSVLPLFRVHRVLVDDLLYVLISVDEFTDQPVVCTKDLHGRDGKLILRAGAIYTRTADAKSTEVSTAADMGRLLDLAVRKRGDALLAQIASLAWGRVPIPPPPEAEAFENQVTSAENFFARHELTGPHWEVIISPSRFVERLVATRPDLQKARDDAAVALRGWNFPHVDRERSGAFSEGIQSVTRWMYHYEAHRVFFSGLFVWRGLLREDFEAGLRNTLLYESTIWSFTEIWLFASQFLPAILETGDVVVNIAIRGLQGRRLVPAGRAIHLQDYTWDEDQFRQHVTLSIAELRARHNELALAGVTELFELCGLPAPPGSLQSWQEKLLKREF